MSILALLLTVQAVPEIRSDPIDANRFRLSIGGHAKSVAAGQAAAGATARRLCGPRPPSFGRFRLVGSELEQELFCGTPKVDPSALATPGWQPSAGDQQAVVAASHSYFSAKDTGRYRDAWSMLAESMKAANPAVSWQRSAADLNARAGAVRARRVTEITWYRDPPGAPRPGMYVAADYSGEFEKLEFVCGYLMWLLQPDGTFRLTREEQNLFDKAAAKNLASIDRKPLRAQMGCKD